MPTPKELLAREMAQFPDADALKTQVSGMPVAPNNQDPFGATKMVDVWDPKGEKHTVPNLNAHDLVMHLKWTRFPPVVIEREVAPAAPAVAGKGKRGKQSAEAAPAPEVIEEQPATPPGAIDVDNLDAMSREGLLRTCSQLDITPDPNWSNTDLIDNIKVEIEVRGED